MKPVAALSAALLVACGGAVKSRVPDAASDAGATTDGSYSDRGDAGARLSDSGVVDAEGDTEASCPADPVNTCRARQLGQSCPLMVSCGDKPVESPCHCLAGTFGGEPAYVWTCVDPCGPDEDAGQCATEFMFCSLDGGPAGPVCCTGLQCQVGGPMGRWLCTPD